jgi:hypothetical protein
MPTRARSVGIVLAGALALSGTLPTVAEDSTFAPNPHPHSPVVDWVEAMLMAVERHPPAPTVTTWRMWVTMASVYDAWSAYHPEATGVVTGDDLEQPPAARTSENQAMAVDQAAFDALSYVYPQQIDLFREVLATHGRGPSQSLDPRTPEGVGRIAADAVIRSRLTDGSNAGSFADEPSTTFPTPYQPSIGDPNHWQPLHVPTGTSVDKHGTPTWTPDDPASFTIQSFVTPQWGAVTPFALTSGRQFRPPGPPQYGSQVPYVDALGTVTTNDAAFRAQTAELLRISGSLTDEQKVIAEFWADGPHTWTPPGHWMQIAIGVSLRDHHDIEQDACMFMALTGALLDAGIAAWDAKRAYDYVRPATSIPFLYGGRRVLAWAGPDAGARLIDGSEWRPYQSATFVTPPFAEYVSGHSTFSAAAAEVLSDYAGSDRMFDGVTRLGRDYDGDGVEDFMGQHIAVPGTLRFEHGPSDTVVLRWETFGQASDQAGISRRYGGIHFQDADLRGRTMGREIGKQAILRASQLWGGEVPAGS